MFVENKATAKATPFDTTIDKERIAMSDAVSINADNINIKYDNGDVIYIDSDGLHAPYRCGMCGNLIGHIDGFSFDKDLTRAIERKTKVDGVYVCDDCYDMIKHISNYAWKIKE